jgi:hypothetical protein
MTAVSTIAFLRQTEACHTHSWASDSTLIKVAGFRGIAITIMGRCEETGSGEFSKDADAANPVNGVDP